MRAGYGRQCLLESSRRRQGHRPNLARRVAALLARAFTQGPDDLGWEVVLAACRWHVEQDKGPFGHSAVDGLASRTSKQSERPPASISTWSVFASVPGGFAGGEH